MNNIVPIEFSKNLGILSEKEWLALSKTKILIIGLGGLGGYLANSLIRLGIRELILIDPDQFSSSNLNRQLFSSHDSIGKFKVEVVKSELLKISSNLDIEIHKDCVQNLDVNTFDKIDIIVDCVDDIPTKLFLEEKASIHLKPLLHGAIGGWYGQIGIALPGSNLLHEMYGNQDSGLETSLRSPTFMPAVVANLMVSELVKFFLNKTEVLRNQIMMIDVLNHEYKVIYKK